jgi:hypothetical protein
VVQVEASVAPPQLGAARAPLAFPYWNPTAGPDGRADAPAGSLSVGMSGPLAVVSDDVAAVGSATFTVAGTGGLEALAWPATGTPQEQLDAWVWSHMAIEHGRQLAPDLLWLQQPLGIHVNFDDGSGFPYCNAFYMADLPEAPNPGDIHFFRAGGNAEAQCINTATVPHVVMHEWGHGFHDHLNPNRAYDETDRSISEGIGDYISATVLDDPIMPVNAIFTPESPFQAEPRLVENTFVYPGDLQGQVHWDGQIWSGTWWDVRKGMRARYGEVVGTRMADDLHTRAVRGGPVWTTAYAVTIGLDDDDDDPSNGTPHSCEINAAFAAHGLAAATPVPSRGSLRFTHTPAASAIEGDQTIALAVQTAAGCGDLDPASVSVIYQIGAAPAVTLPMTAAASGFEAVVPALVAGDIVTYRFTARATDGAEASWPAGGGQYALVVDGGDQPLIAWDFEDGGMGWTTGGSSPIANDWQFGAPAGKAGDPARAGGGAISAGTDLGVVSNGAYEPTASTTWLATPAVECGGPCSELRVRFRRHLSLAAGDSARVKVGDQVVWEVTGPLQDPDWTWQEVALTAVTATESIQIGFELQSDGTAEAGGWNLDDVALFKPPGSDDDGASGGCGCGAGGGSSGAMALILLAISLAFAPGRGRGRRSRSSSRR